MYVCVCECACCACKCMHESNNCCFFFSKCTQVVDCLGISGTERVGVAGGMHERKQGVKRALKSETDAQSQC